MTQFFLGGKCQILDGSGNPLIGGLVYTYETDGVTPKTTWSDSALTTPNANPVVLDSEGRASIYMSGTYDVTVKTSGGTTVYTATDIAGSGPGGHTYTSTDITISNGGDGSFAHGLPGVPDLVQAWLIVDSTTAGYAAGDQVLVNPNMQNNFGIQVWMTATQVGYVFAAVAIPLVVLHKTTGVATNFTNANGHVILRAIKWM